MKDLPLPEAEVLAVWILTASLLSPCVAPWTVSSSWPVSGLVWDIDSDVPSCNPSLCTILDSETSKKNVKYKYW